MGTLLGRYLLREIAGSWLAVTGVLLMILLANQVAFVLQRAAVNQYPQAVVLELIGLGALQNVSLLLPVGLLLGIVLAFGRLYHDSEMTAAFACGAQPRVLYRPLALFALVIALVLAALTLSIAPQAIGVADDLRSAAIRAGQYAPLAPGRFRSFGNGSAVVYAEDVNADGTLARVFVERNVGAAVEVAVADRARHTVTLDGLTHTLTLFDGERFVGIPGSREFRILRFREHTVPVQVPSAAGGARGLDSAPTGGLLGAGDPRREAELQWRIARPVMALVLAALAIPLARLRPRQGRYGRVWLAVIVYFVYSNLVAAGKVWLEHGRLPALTGLWWTHVLIVMLTLAALAAPRRLRSKA